MKRQPKVAVLAAIVGAAVAVTSCATAPRPRLGLTILPASIGAVPSSGSRHAPEPLGVTVHPRIAFGGDSAAVRMRVEPSALSRSLEVSWWTTDGIGGSHLITLDGDRAARRYDVPLKRLDPGQYEVTAILLRADGTRIRRSTTIMVVGR